MARNMVFVLGDLKIRIVFPLNQWAVYFTAMNNALALQTFPSSLSFSVLSGVYSASTVQCLKCFQPFTLDNKVKILIILLSSTLFSLNDAPGSADDDNRSIYRLVERTLFQWNDTTFEMIGHVIFTFFKNALWITERREREACVWFDCGDKLSLTMLHTTLSCHLCLSFPCLAPLQRFSSIH